jgi:hypothetical protein
MQSFEVCLELMIFLQEKLAPKCAAKQEELSGTALSAIREFQQWLAPLNREVWKIGLIYLEAEARLEPLGASLVWARVWESKCT